MFVYFVYKLHGCVYFLGVELQLQQITHDGGVHSGSVPSLSFHKAATFLDAFHLFPLMNKWLATYSPFSSSSGLANLRTALRKYARENEQ